jgi:hypothetical protein
MQDLAWKFELIIEQGGRIIFGDGTLHGWLKSGADARNWYSASATRRDFRPTFLPLFLICFNLCVFASLREIFVL